MAQPSTFNLQPSTSQYVRGLIEAAGAVRVPELLRERPPEALYWVRRGGVTTTALRTRSIPPESLVELLKFRFGQYVHPAVDIVNTGLTLAGGMRHGSPAYESAEDVHFLAGCGETGELYCCTVLRTLEALPGTTLRIWERPLFPLERVHGWGLFNRLRTLPDLPMGGVRELGRCAQNRQLDPGGELYSRAEAEVGVALCRTLTGPLREEAPAVIGDVEARELPALELLHLPAVLIRGTVPYAPEASFYTPRYENNTVYPFALLTADLIGAPRLDAIERALLLPGEAGRAAVDALRADARLLPSSLEPDEGMSALSAAEQPQRELRMDARRSMLQMGERLRLIDLFADLSDAEVRILGTFMERLEFPSGEAIVRQGEAGDALYLIENGEVEAQARLASGERATLAVLGPGDHFGEIALLRGIERTADVIARTRATVLRLGQDAYRTYLSQLCEVRDELTRTTLERLSDQ